MIKGSSFVEDFFDSEIFLEFARTFYSRETVWYVWRPKKKGKPPVSSVG